MELDKLRQRLQDPDQWVRVEALRILAMVEETRALRDIGWVFRNDPEPGVRQVAHWAGRIVYAAYQQARQMTGPLPPPAPTDDREEALLSSLVETDSLIYNQMQEQLLQHELADTLHEKRSTQQRPSLGPGRLPGGRVQPQEPVTPSKEIEVGLLPDTLALLDAGLSEDFFEP